MVWRSVVFMVSYFAHIYYDKLYIVFADEPIDVDIFDRSKNDSIENALRTIVANDYELAATQLSQIRTQSTTDDGIICNRTVHLLLIRVLYRLHRYEEMIRICRIIDSTLYLSTRIKYWHICALYGVHTMDTLDKASKIIDDCREQIESMNEWKLIDAMIAGDRGDTSRAWNTTRSIDDGSAILHYVHARLYR